MRNDWSISYYRSIGVNDVKWSAESRCVGEVACPLKYNNLFVVCTKNTQLLKCLHFLNHEARIKVSQLVYLVLRVAHNLSLNLPGVVKNSMCNYIKT